MVENIIPKQLQDIGFKFLLIKPNGKEPIESKWESDNCYDYDNPKLKKHLNNKGNYGIIGGYGNLIIIDADSEEVKDICEKELPETFTIQSSKEYKRHYYFITSCKMKPIRLSKEKLGDLGDIRSTGQYVVAPNSIHPLGMKYKVIKDIPITYFPEFKIKQVFNELIDPSVSTEKITTKFKVDTTLRNTPFIRECKMPDYCVENKLKGNTSKNWQLFRYLVDILHNRQVSSNYYFKLLQQQGHSLGAIKGWVDKAREGSLAKCSCKQMKNYIQRYHPELEEDICGKCKLHKKIKKLEEMKRANEFNYRL